LPARAFLYAAQSLQVVAWKKLLSRRPGSSFDENTHPKTAVFHAAAGAKYDHNIV